MIKVFLAFCFLAFSFKSEAKLLQFGLNATVGRMQFSDQMDLDKYAEVELFSDYAFSKRFGFRLGAFGRAGDEERFTGLQAVLPLKLTVKSLAFSTYIAPGYRFMSRGFHAPSFETGFAWKTWGLGYRLIFNDWVKNGLETESQFFFSVSLGAI